MLTDQEITYGALIDVDATLGLDSALAAPTPPEDIILGLTRSGVMSDVAARLFACACVEHVLPRHKKEYPDDKRPRKAIETARAFVRGDATQKELDAAWVWAKMAWTWTEAVWVAAAMDACAPTHTAGYWERKWQLAWLASRLRGQGSWFNIEMENAEIGDTVCDHGNTTLDPENKCPMCRVVELEAQVNSLQEENQQLYNNLVSAEDSHGDALRGAI